MGAQTKAIVINDRPPISELSDESVDLVLCHSVFTHLPEDIQLLWLDELARICSAKAVLSLSFHGEGVLNKYLSGLINPDERVFIEQEISNNGFYYSHGRRQVEEDLPNYYGSAFHSILYINKIWTKNFRLLAWVPEGALSYQDIILLERSDKPVVYFDRIAQCDNTGENDSVDYALLKYVYRNSRWIKLGKKLGFLKALK